MLYRNHRPAVLVQIVLASLLLAGLLPGSTDTARATVHSIQFDEIVSYAQNRSPQSRILTQQLEKVRAERDDALQWSNPEITYEHEGLEPFSEWAFTVQKRFEMPFSHSASRDGWAKRVNAAELRFDQDLSDLVADLQTGYVLLQLLDAYRDRLNRLEEIVHKASDVAEARHGEGDISGIDKHLIQHTALALDASRRDALAERKRAAAQWYAVLGFPPGDEAVLVTPVPFRPVTLAPPEEYVAMLEHRPAVQSRLVLHRALGKQAEAARPSLVPAFEVYVGYKHIEPVLDGWMAGGALTLPLFDRKAGPARQLEAEQRIVENEIAMYRTRTAGEITVLVQLIEDAGRSLSSIAIHADDDASVIASLLFSYQEGRYTLEAFLNAIQIEVTGSKGYFDQLFTYYENIFRLEALTGAAIVSFSPEESESQ